MRDKHWERVEELLKLYSGRGVTLKHLVGPKYFGVKLDTLKAYCRDFGVAFPDYVPRKLKPKNTARN